MSGLSDLSRAVDTARAIQLLVRSAGYPEDVVYETWNAFARIALITRDPHPEVSGQLPPVSDPAAHPRPSSERK